MVVKGLDPGGNCITGCAHVFHRQCIEKTLERAQTCPLCRAEVNNNQLIEYVEPIKHEDDAVPVDTIGADFVGAKTTYLIDYLQNSMAPDEKLVVSICIHLTSAFLYYLF